MLEMIVFALVLVTAQLVGSYIMMRIMMKQFMNKEFIKKQTKMITEITQDLINEMEATF